MGASHQTVIGSLGGAPDASLKTFLEGDGHRVTAVLSDDALLEYLRSNHCDLAVVRTTPPLSEASQEHLRQLLGMTGPVLIVLLADGEIARVDGHPGLVRLPCAATPDEIRAGIQSVFEGKAYHWASDLGLDVERLATLQFSDRGGATQGLRFFLQFARDLSRHASFSRMLDFALQEFMRLFRCESGSIYLWDAEHRELVLRTAAGPDRELRIGHRQRVGEGIAGWVAEVGEALLVTDVRRVEHIKGRDFDRYPTYSCLAAPLKQDGQLIGVVALTMRQEGQEFAMRDLELMTSLCHDLFAQVGPISVVNELRRFTEELQREVDRSRVRVAEKERQLEALQAFSQNIVESIPTGIITYDRNLHVQFCNALARELLGGAVRANEDLPLAGIRMSETVWRDQLREAVTSGKETRFQRYAYGEGDNARLLDVQVGPLRTDVGEILGGLLAVQDVTEEVELERKLMRSERLALLGKLASRVAHELNNPLDGIMRFMNLAIARLREDPDRATGYLEEGRRGLTRMANIITELLVFSRNQYAQGQMKTIDAVVLDSVAMFEQRARSQNVRIDLDVPTKLPVSPTRELDEVFSNLIKNALDMMPNGGSLNLKARLDGAAVTVDVTDDGPGVPEPLREKIFEPFVTTKTEGGTGLGLAICRDILSRVGGTITLTPAASGASFRVVVPVKTIGSQGA